jgi:ATP-binding cassette subfamily F protein uup
VRSLSGGERARLLLARLFARPANVLVLDEPTNDLDIETLELLEALLQDYAGAVLLVSHDRAFLNNVVTQTIASEGEGVWRDYVGGYDEWIAQRGEARLGQPGARAAPAAQAPRPGAAPKNTAKDSPPRVNSPGENAAKTERAKPARTARLSSWEERELNALPDLIAAIEARQAALSNQLADGGLYHRDPGEAARVHAELANLEQTLEEKFARWELLENKRGA